MSDYTPRTHEVREGWVYYCYEAFWLMKNRRTDYREQFDRWLAAHDAEVYQQAREDAAKIAEDFGLNYPYSVWPAFAPDDRDVSRDRVSASMGRHASNVIAGLIRAAARGDGEQ